MCLRKAQYPFFHTLMSILIPILPYTHVYPDTHSSIHSCLSWYSFFHTFMSILIPILLYAHLYPDIHSSICSSLSWYSYFRTFVSILIPILPYTHAIFQTWIAAQINIFCIAPLIPNLLRSRTASPGLKSSTFIFTPTAKLEWRINDG